MDTLFYIIAGASVGFAVGLTGVGGGSLMTPLLLLFGFPPPIAIGTDLIYAAVTKGSGVIVHQKHKNINWKIVIYLAIASIPASLLVNHFVVGSKTLENFKFHNILTISLGIMLILTSMVLIFKRQIKDQAVQHRGYFSNLTAKYPMQFTILSGLFLGVFVTLSSVGAGAFGTAVLISLYPHLRTAQIIGTDIAHAVPLTLIAGLGYMYHGYVDYYLLASLLIGSLPAMYIGTRLSSRLPEQIIKSILASALFMLGVKYSFF